MTDVSEGSLADSAGLLIGDAILRMDDFIPTKDLTIEQITDKVKSKVSHTSDGVITVTVLRKSILGEEM